MLPDGRILECRRNPLPGGGLIVMYNDVSEQRHADYLVKETARQLRFILDRAPVALAMIGQEDGRLKHANARFHKLFGLPDRRPHEASDLATHFAAEDRARILAARTGTAAVEFETTVRRADGSPFFALVAAVRYVFEWEPTSLVTFHDISDRRRAEAGLQEELRRRRAELDEARRLQLDLVPAPQRLMVGTTRVAVDVVRPVRCDVRRGAARSFSRRRRAAGGRRAGAPDGGGPGLRSWPAGLRRHRRHAGYDWARGLMLPSLNRHTILIRASRCKMSVRLFDGNHCFRVRRTG
jgi:PAS domain S-box-containing protein